MEKKIAIRGHKTRGRDVIRALEGMGGTNEIGFDGSDSNYAYYIRHDFMISLEMLYKPPLGESYSLYTIEEYEEYMKNLKAKYSGAEVAQTVEANTDCAKKLAETPKFKEGDCVKCSDGSCGIIVTCDWSDSLNCYQYYINYIGTLDAGYQSEKDLQSHSITTMNGRDIFEGAKWKHEFECPEGYVFKDENGNVINATKIVLEKKKKEAILTQEQIDTMVHESCVLFCKHCGCGVPRETCTSLGSCKDHDEYRKSMRTYFEKHKK